MQDLVTIMEGKERDNFSDKLRDVLDHQMDYVIKIEKRLAASSDFSALRDSIDPRKGGQSLEKLSAVELESIRKELTRQRDTMSRRIERHAEINHRMEKEREHVFRQIQEEGKMLIKKCNILRKHGLILKYRIGVKEKEAKELRDEIEVETAKLGDNNQATRVKDTTIITEKRPQMLPYIEYRQKNQPRRVEAPKPEKPSIPLSHGIYTMMMKKRHEMVKEMDERHSDIEKLANIAKQEGKDIENYLVGNINLRNWLIISRAKNFFKIVKFEK